MRFVRRVALALGLWLPVSAVAELSSIEDQKLDFVAERCANSAADGIPIEECEEAAVRSFEIRQLMRAANAMRAGKSASEAAELFGVSAETLSAVEAGSAAEAE